MSNWACVVVVWSGIEHSGHDAQWHHRRLDEVNAALKAADDYHVAKRWVVAWPCSEDESLGPCCEFVAVTHWNHFWPTDGLISALGSFDWRYRDQVGVLWKTEDHDTYQSMYLEEEVPNDD